MSILSKIAAYVPAMPSISSCRAQIGQYSGRMVAYITTGFSSIQTQVSKIAASASYYLTQAFAQTKPYVAQAVSKLPNLTPTQKLIGVIGTGLLIGAALTTIILLETDSMVQDAKEVKDGVEVEKASGEAGDLEAGGLEAGLVESKIGQTITK